MAKQRYGQNPGPNAHNEKPVPKEVPKEWLFEVNAPDIGNVSTTNDEHFEERDDGRVLSGECMKNRLPKDRLTPNCSTSSSLE